MRLLPRITALAALSFLLLSPGAGAFLARESVHLSVEVIVAPVAGTPRSLCRVSGEVPTYRRVELGIVVPGTSSEGTTGGPACAIGLPRRVDAETAESPYLIAEISAVGKLVRPMVGDTVLEVDVDVSLEKRVDDPAGEELFESSQLVRELFFAGSREVWVPLLVAGGSEREDLGLAEVLLRVEASTPAHGPAGRFGELWVTAGEGGELLLDGAVVAAVEAGSTTVLRNVPPGVRQVALRPVAVPPIAEAVRVVGGRTVLVSLEAAAPSDGGSRFRLDALGPNTEGYGEYRRAADGAVVVAIPAGEFLMGNEETERSPLEHEVYVSTFLIDKLGVTWGQYKAFAAATGRPLPAHEPYWGIFDDHPAVYVTWEEASRYCEWVGGRLPTEAEREKAARGTDGRKYPWGDQEPEPHLGVYRRAWGHEATAAVGTHPAGASPYGVQDMGGNVWEWCADWYDDDYFAVSPYRDPKGPASGNAHVLRGGSWDSRPTVLSASCRNWGHRGYREGDFGFRCAMNAPPDSDAPD